MTNIEIKPSRGEVWLVNLNSVENSEQIKKIPYVVISNNLFNHGPAGFVVVLPLTPNYEKLSWLVEVVPPEGEFKQTFYVISNQINTVAKERFSSKPTGRLTQKTLMAIKSRLQILLDL